MYILACLLSNTRSYKILYLKIFTLVRLIGFVKSRPGATNKYPHFTAFLVA